MRVQPKPVGARLVLLAARDLDCNERTPAPSCCAPSPPRHRRRRRLHGAAVRIAILGLRHARHGAAMSRVTRNSAAIRPAAQILVANGVRKGYLPPASAASPNDRRRWRRVNWSVRPRARCGYHQGIGHHQTPPPTVRGHPPHLLARRDRLGALLRHPGNRMDGQQIVPKSAAGTGKRIFQCLEWLPAAPLSTHCCATILGLPGIQM
jgi:hypothetical protein